MIDKIDWGKNPLIPVVVQDASTLKVLMLAYTNKEALMLTLSTKEAHYFSRSKNRLWRKGEESGHTQEIQDILIDCDEDSIVFLVKQNGVACHTGNESCFYRELDGAKNISTPKIDMTQKYSIIDVLYHEILSKRYSDTQTSYTAKLFSKGENTIGKKIVEESGELAFAIKDKNKDEVVYECADLAYHVLVGLVYADVNPELVKQELKRRFGISGITEKNSRNDS